MIGARNHRSLFVHRRLLLLGSRHKTSNMEHKTASIDYMMVTIFTVYDSAVQPCCRRTRSRGLLILRRIDLFTGGTGTKICLVLLCVCVCFLPIHSGHQIRWTYQPGSHRRKVTQDFSSTFFLRCVPYFFSREGFSRSFPSSTVKSNFVY